jgi:hypothetical protein
MNAIAARLGLRGGGAGSGAAGNKALNFILSHRRAIHLFVFTFLKEPKHGL